MPTFDNHKTFMADLGELRVGFLGCKCTLLARVQFFIHQCPQILPCRTALNPFFPQSVLILGIALIQVQDLALGLVELHEVHMGPLLKPVKVSLDGIPSLRHANCTTQLGVICKLAEGALNPAIYVIDEDIKYFLTSQRSQNSYLSHGENLAQARAFALTFLPPSSSHFSLQSSGVSILIDIG
ncbi:hypothetical protein QYF61_017492 [Mycteria americana]|uniref:Uncharacterized protein n=1 Tax=Mycteria americana TaxID=33587 RepID=A0AAN7SIF2_MYCAM|nr:hypothetical protein QYF61_017492 [Mycteria americana]